MPIDRAETLKKAEKEIKAAGSGESIALDVADARDVRDWVAFHQEARPPALAAVG